MAIIEIKTSKGSTIGVFQLYENNENGEVEIQQVKGDISIEDIDTDDLFLTNDKKVGIRICPETEKTAWHNAFKDFMELNSQIQTYNYIAEKDICYWYDLAEDDEYDRYLINLCEKYDIELDYRSLEQDSIHEEIYQMEQLLNDVFKYRYGIEVVK